MITWHVINSLLAGALVFFGAFVDGEITKVGLLASASASFIVALTKFKEFWETQDDGITPSFFHFIH